MPAIKKRITAEYRAEQEQRGEENGGPDADSELVDAADSISSAPQQVSVTLSSSLKRKIPRSGEPPGPLKGLDGEVLLEKRRRFLPVAESKLSGWLESNFEKKPELHVSAQKLYLYYTDMCQQEGGGVLDFRDFNKMLRAKLGTEFGVKEDSIYKGQLREKKTEKKSTVKAQTLGLKLKDLVEEALRASGSPKKGVRFPWIKQYLAAKYPALMIPQRPGNLKTALERGVSYGKVELVKGIGFCGYYRLPGPPEVEEEEEPKDKKKGKVDDVESQSEDKADSSSTEPKKDETDEAAKEADEDSPKGKTATQKKPKRKANKRVRRPRQINHSDPERVEDIFPLAMTYMSEPKEASTSKIKKYLEKYYGKVDIENRLKKTLMHGLELGMWDRVSGNGASGTFQLQVDTFNPQHTESLMDMVCSAIIACSEPKIASFQLLKSYIKEYHSEFGIDIRPSLLKKAIARALQQGMILRVSGIGMSGSFQLAQSFTPSPAILAGEEEEGEDGEEDNEENEVYVVRKTKSGRSAPLKPNNQGRSLKESTPSKRGRMGSTAAEGMSKKAVRKRARSESEEDVESEDSEEEPDDSGEKYVPRKTKSRQDHEVTTKKKASAAGRNKKELGGKKNRLVTPDNKTSAKGNSERVAGRKRTQSAQLTDSSRKERPGRASAVKTGKKLVPEKDDTDEEEERELVVSTPIKSARSFNASYPSKSLTPRKQASRQAVAEETDEEENYYEVEEVKPLKKKRESKAEQEKLKKNKKEKKANADKPVADKEFSPSTRPVRSPRVTNKPISVSYRELDSDDSSSDEEPVARSTVSSKMARKL